MPCHWGEMLGTVPLGLATPQTFQTKGDDKICFSGDIKPSRWFIGLAMSCKRFLNIDLSYRVALRKARVCRGGIAE